MRTKIIVIVMSMLLIMPMTAFADEQLADAGITPDSPLYYFDQLGEEIGLLLEDDPIEEAKLLDGYAEESLAESNEMAIIGETELAEETLVEYQELVTEVANTVEAAIEDGQDVTELVETITDRTEIREEIITEVLESLPEEAGSLVEEKIEASNLRLATVNAVLIGLVDNEEFVTAAKASGLSFREILVINSLAGNDQVNKSLDEIMELFLNNGKDIGATIAALGLTEEAMKEINKDFKEAKGEIKETFRAEKEALKEEVKTKVEEKKEQAKQVKEQAKEEAKQIKEQAKQVEEKAKEEAKKVEEQTIDAAAKQVEQEEVKDNAEQNEQEVEQVEENLEKAEEASKADKDGKQRP